MCAYRGAQCVGKLTSVVYGAVHVKFRRFSSSKMCSSYVQDVRLQMDIKRSKKISSSSYRDGEFLVMDSSKELVLVSRKNNDKESRLLWTPYNELESIGIKVEEEAIFLRCVDGKCNFAVNIDSLSKDSKLCLESKVNSAFMSLRASLFNLVAPGESDLVAQSYSLLNWRLKHKFCVYCGGTLQNDNTGTQKQCSGCKVIHYPTVNPVGITLICDRHYSKVLLVRQPVHPPRMFTCIAGFIETGESIEENVKREVAEEVGLVVNDIQYAGSQHWALRGSRLMIGCFATVKDENFVIDPVELEEANWFYPEQVRSALIRVTEKKEKLLKNPQDIWLPPPGAIAYTLLKTWLEKYH